MLAGGVVRIGILHTIDPVIPRGAVASVNCGILHSRAQTTVRSVSLYNKIVVVFYTVEHRQQ